MSVFGLTVKFPISVHYFSLGCRKYVVTRESKLNGLEIGYIFC